MGRKRTFWVLGILAVLSGCGGADSAKPGTGAAFSTIAPLPTGTDLFGGLLSGMPKAFGFVYFFQTTDTQGFSSGTAMKSEPCSGGGEVNETFNLSVNGSDAAVSMTGQLNNCTITLLVGTQEYSETLTGSISNRATLKDGASTESPQWRITASGDLGFAANCDLNLGYHKSSAASGKCVFVDVDGSTAEISAENIRDMVVKAVD